MQRNPNQERRPVAKHPGIFVRTLASGQRRYVVFYRTTDGRQRWETIEGGLREAIAAQDEIRARKRRGERVAPTKATLGEIADAWLAAQTQLRPRTRQWYETALRVHVKPRLGRVRIAELNEEHITDLIGEMQAAGKASATIRGTLTPLGRVLSYAARRGLIASNPIGKLERGERPSPSRREMRILSREEIGKLLSAASDAKHTPYFAIIAVATFSGLRLGELLGLTWADVDFEGGFLRVRKQLDRAGQRVEPKTAQGVREVVLFPALATILRAQREKSFALGRAKPGALVFCAPWSGGPLNGRNVAQRGLAKAIERAGLGGDGRPKLRFHDLRHTFASLLVAQGRNVVFVSRQLGHASPDITLRVYSHLFDQAEHAQRAREEMEQQFAGMLAVADSSAGVVELRHDVR